MRDRSATHSAQWQDLELIFGWLLQHRNMRERRERVVYASLRSTETFMHVCLRPTEAARFCVRKCTNNHQLIVAVVPRFLRHTCAAHFRAKRRVRYIYMLTLIGVFFVHRNGNMHAWKTRMKSVLLRWTPSLNDRSKLKGECTGVQSGCSTSVGPSLNPHSLS